MAKILFIDHQHDYYRSLAAFIEESGHECHFEPALKTGMTNINSDFFDLVFIRDNMPDGRGFDLLPQIFKLPWHPEVIIIADHPEPNEAERAIRMGAWDYVERPASTERLKLILVRALQYKEKKNPIEAIESVQTELNFEGVVGESPQMKVCLKRIAMAAKSDANVLLSGETGTGKEVVAWAIHKNSFRAGKNFVVVDCASLPDTLVESTLFGHQKGAFTGADATREGLIKQADKGTLFLDEVGEMPLPVQTRFLRVLEERRFRPVGGRQEIRSDFRLIAATNRDLNEMVDKKEFRKDLLFRLKSFEIETPSLRERKEDVQEIARYHLKQVCESYGLPPKEFSNDFFEALAEYDWPGNVRELVNAMERAVAAARHDPVLFPQHLPINIRVNMLRETVQHDIDRNPSAVEEILDQSRPLPPLQQVRDATLAELENKYLRELMSRSRGNIKEACQTSGLSRSRLYALLQKYEIPTGG